jgi:hypothetical protein
MIASIPTAIPAMIQLCTPRGRTPRGTGRLSVTVGGPAATVVGLAVTVGGLAGACGVSAMTHRSC